MMHNLYALVFETDSDPVIFYIGHTNDLKRRETEHRSCVKDLSNTEYKYRWCRELEAIGIDWYMVDLGSVEKDEDSEYAFILKIARHNRSKNITFIDDLPLTNMKAGDFLHEIIDRKDIKTVADIKRFKKEKAEAKRAVKYEREEKGILPELSPKAKLVAEWMQAEGEVVAAQDAERKKKAKQRAKRYFDMLNDPARIERIKQETERLSKE